MSRRDDTVRLRHMLDAARKAREFSAGLSFDAVRGDEMRTLALVRLLEVIGEAARAVSREYRKHHPEIPWSGVVGLRDRLIHGYDAVDFEIVWRIIEDELPVLISNLESLLGEGGA